MANNFVVKDAVSANITIESSEDTPGIQTPVHHVKSLPNDPLGLMADAAVITDTGGSLSAKLRGLVKWAFERMPASLGQKTKANSLPVVLASDSDGMAVGASENHLGSVGNELVSLTLNPTVTTGSAYTIGDCVGGLLSFVNIARIAAGTGQILAALIGDKAQQSSAYQLLFFDANPTSSTFTDKAAAVLDPGDIAKLIGNISFASYTSVGVRSLCHMESKIAFALASGRTVYAALVLQGTNPVPTFATTTDIIIKLWARQN